jgi:plasmid stabilization system protein ParE
MRLRFAPRATRDLVDIADYLAIHDPAASRRVRAVILEFYTTLFDFQS